MSFEKRRPFGRTGRLVHPIGISSSYGLDADGVEEAVDSGVNYIFYGSMRRASFGEGIRRVAKKNREDLLVVMQTYLRFFPALQTWDIERGLKKAGIDYADVLLLGWYNQPPSKATLENAMKLKDRGLVRLIGVSTHQRSSVVEMEKLGGIDLYHIRYNAVHRGAERDIFPYLREDASPGIVAFTATRWGHLLDPKRMPPGEKAPSAADVYRFCLTDPHVHTIATGPASREQLRESLKAVELGPLSSEELARMRRIGDHIYGAGPSVLQTARDRV